MSGRAPARLAAECALLALLYSASGKIGLELGFSGPVAAVVWLPAGVGIAFLALRGLRCWPGALVGDLLVNTYSAVALVGGIGQTVGNVLEVVIGAALIRYWLRRGPLLERVPGVIRLLAALAAGTAVSALVGPLSLIAAGKLSWHAAPIVMRTWWLGDLTGALVVVPFALAWFGAGPADRFVRRGLLAGLLLLTAAFSLVALGEQSPLAYLVFPALMVSAILLGARGATAAVVVAAAFVALETTYDEGPFSSASTTRSVLAAQLFIAVAAVSTLVVSALTEEREEMSERAQVARADVVRVAYTERHRLERNLHDGAQQRLLALRMQLRSLGSFVQGDTGQAALHEVDRELQIALDELRALARGTFPPVLVERGLAGAIGELVARSPLAVVVLDLPRLRADVPTEAVAYYVAAEALANAEKHATPSWVWLSVTTTPVDICVAVIDNGAGTAVERPGSGLAGLRERTEAVGGTFTLLSSPGRGTCVAATVPAAAFSPPPGRSQSAPASAPL